MLAFLREHNDAQSVIDIFNNIENIHNIDVFKSLFPVILTDNGSEFSNPLEIEYSYKTGEQRTNIFYCEPGRPDQKGSCEVNHEIIRRILPKGTSFDNLTQEDINKIISSEMVFYKIITSHKDKETIRDLKEKINKIGGLAVASISEYDIEVNDIQAQKGLILAKVAKMKGIKKDEVMVLGDSFNDYSMFTEFKNSYAMKNAMDEIKKIATYITETNNNDGVGKAIEKVLNMQ